MNQNPAGVTFSIPWDKIRAECMFLEIVVFKMYNLIYLFKHNNIFITLKLILNPNGVILL